jgi:hypothetical protein
MSYAVKLTVPVYVVIGDGGEVERVVIEDDNLSAPVALVPVDVDPANTTTGWDPAREIPWDQVDQVDRDQYRTDASAGSWPGWDFGW